MKIASNNSKNLENIFQTLKNVFRDFPGSPVVKTSPSNAGSVSSIPGWGAKIPTCLMAKKLKCKTEAMLVTNSNSKLVVTNSNPKKVHVKKKSLKIKKK